MKDAFELLYQKEADLARVRQEIESLAMVAPLLADEVSSGDSTLALEDQNKKPAENAISAFAGSEATGTDGVWSIGRRRGFWDALKRRR